MNCPACLYVAPSQQHAATVDNARLRAILDHRARRAERPYEPVTPTEKPTHAPALIVAIVLAIAIAAALP